MTTPSSPDPKPPAGSLESRGIEAMDKLVELCENGVTAMTSQGDVVQITAPAAYYAQLGRWLEKRAAIKRALDAESGVVADPAERGVAAMFARRQAPDLDHPALKPIDE